MTPRSLGLMNVLVIGDGHIYGCGLKAGQLNYIGHFIRQFRRTTQAVNVEAYAHLTMPQLLATLRQLPLNRYDLIILQPDALSAFQPVHQQPHLGEWVLPMLAQPLNKPGVNAGQQSVWSVMLDRVRLFCRALRQAQRMRSSLSTLLKVLRPYRHTVLLLTPLPQRRSLAQWLTQRSRNLLLHEAGNQLFSVFDSDQVLLPHDEYFLADTGQYLNAISHELLGQALFEFYQSAPTIVTVQTIRNESNPKPDVSDK